MRMREVFAHGLELLVHFQIKLGFRVINGFSHVAPFGGFSWWCFFGNFGVEGVNCLSI